MEEINIIYWHVENKTLNNVQVENYGLTQAIEQLRHENDFKILILSAEYADIQNVINSIS